eukprot:TRINITY_DN4729_c0_g1_i1.p1 TRINITY_DN4729_c0_g1~~TRINITY_DN4729_c0_g1_i1.p1  ORF type:complete len:343 (-),score=95.92 TRINITY_DN4729_c0_g1_i1:87-1115(-)
MEALTKQHIAIKEDRSSNRPECLYCWLMKTRECVCPKMRQITSANWYPHKIIILMHYREYRRASNTAKIIMASMPNSVEIYLYGLDSTIKDLIERIKQDPYRVCILYPSIDSISVEDFVANIHKPETYLSPSNDGDQSGATIFDKEEESNDEPLPSVESLLDTATNEEQSSSNNNTRSQEEASESANEEEQEDEDSDISVPFTGESLTVVLIDGTWNQAKRMFKILQDNYALTTNPPQRIKSIRLRPSAPSRFKARQQPSPTQISTLEAFVLFARQIPPPLGRLPKVDEEIMHENMDIVMDALLKQTNNPTKTNHKRWVNHFPDHIPENERKQKDENKRAER